jgi:hypothetical protein
MYNGTLKYISNICTSYKLFSKKMTGYQFFKSTKNLLSLYSHTVAVPVRKRGNYIPSVGLHSGKFCWHLNKRGGADFNSKFVS